MNIEITRQMIQELENLRDEFNDRFRVILLKWERILVQEEILRDQWANKAEAILQKEEKAITSLEDLLLSNRRFNGNVGQ